MKDDWVRVTKGRCCPICEKPDWCMIAKDGTVAVCARIFDGCVRDLGEAGYLHRLDGPGGRLPPPVTVERRYPAPLTPAPDWSAVWQRLQDGPDCTGFAAELGVSPDSLRKLGIGYSQKHSAWSFPMRDYRDQIIGFRLRSRNGRKFAVRGSRNGMFIPALLSSGEKLLICEGPTSTAAALDLGFNAIGRANSGANEDMIFYWLKLNRIPYVVIMADDDLPGADGRRAGQHYANRLAQKLKGICRIVKVVLPPIGGDFRDWVTNERADWKLVNAVIAMAGVS